MFKNSSPTLKSYIYIGMSINKVKQFPDRKNHLKKTKLSIKEKLLNLIKEYNFVTHIEHTQQR